MTFGAQLTPRAEQTEVVCMPRSYQGREWCRVRKSIRWFESASKLGRSRRVGRGVHKLGRSLGCQPIVIVGSPGDTAWEGRGYRLGEHVIRNATDLVCVMPLTPGAPIIKIPRSPAALMRQRPGASI